MSSLIKEITGSSKFFRFRIEGENALTYTIPQNVVDGSDVIQFQSSWTKENLPGSTEPMVAFNYVDSPTININLDFHEDMWREVEHIGNITSYQSVICAFSSLVYPPVENNRIKSPYVILTMGDNMIYRGFFTNIRINQYGVMRNGYKTSCKINSNFTIIKKTAPERKDVVNGIRVYFSL